jgi:protein phosphatase
VGETRETDDESAGVSPSRRSGRERVHLGDASVVLRWAALTHEGLVRASNQDTFGVAGGVFVVCDGMGGHMGGGRASEIAAGVVTEVSRYGAPTIQSLVATVEAANIAILDESRTDPDLDGMGTTLVALSLAENGGSPTWVALNVGDSRLYVADDEGPRQLSVDHSVVQELIDGGSIAADEVAGHPERHVVTRALGSELAPAADVWLMPPVAGAHFLLTTDGAHGDVDEADLIAALTNDDPVASCDALLRAALATGGRDNITALCVVVDDVVPDAADAIDESTTPRVGRSPVAMLGSEPPEGALITSVPIGRSALSNGELA